MEQLERPPRSSSPETVLIIANAVLLSLSSLLVALRPWTALVAGLLACAALLRGYSQSVHVSLLACLLPGALLLSPSINRWPFSLLIPLLLYLLVAAAVPRLRSDLVRLPAGAIDRSVVMLMIGTTLLSGLGLYLWYRTAAPDISVYLRSMPPMAVWLVPFAGLGFSVLNAAMEEYLFRGVIMRALDSTLGPRVASLLVQAWLFGAVHYLRGFPNGIAGVVLASIYGIMLGIIRRRSGGLLAPWLTHVLADMVIFSILIANR